MINKEFDGQIKINMAETPDDAISYYSINEIQGKPVVVKEDKEDEKQT